MHIAQGGAQLLSLGSAQQVIWPPHLLTQPGVPGNQAEEAVWDCRFLMWERGGKTTTASTFSSDSSNPSSVPPNDKLRATNPSIALAYFCRGFA